MAGTSARPWLIVVADQSHGAFLTIEAGEGKPSPGDVWHYLVEAMLKPRRATRGVRRRSWSG